MKTNTMDQISGDRGAAAASTGFSVRRFWAYWWGTIVSPARTLREVAAEPSLVYATLAYALFALLYSGLALAIYLARGVPNWQPWLTLIPMERYYLWEALFLTPYSMITWVVFAALAYLFSRRPGGAGSFERVLAVFGFTYSVPLVALFWLPDVLQFLMWGTSFHTSLMAIYGTAASVWTALLSIIGVNVVQATSWWRAVLATIVAMTAAFVLSILLIR